MQHEKTPVLVYTDDGRDVDDIEAITYLAGCRDQVDIVGLVTTHMIPDRRALIARAVLDNLGLPGVDIGVGSILPIGKEDASLTKYLRAHTVKGRSTYEGEGIVETYHDGIDLINRKIRDYDGRLVIAALAPLTDLALAAQDDPHNFRRLGGLYIQAQAKVANDGILEPDMAAYNLAEDPEATGRIFSHQNHIPMYFAGKHAAYQLPLYRDDFAQLAATGNPVGTYMDQTARLGLEVFAERSPEIFERVFGLPAHRVNETQELSKPYDALVAQAIVGRGGHDVVQVGHHRLVGMTPEQPGIPDPAATKRDLMDTMLQALRSTA